MEKEALDKIFDTTREIGMILGKHQQKQADSDLAAVLRKISLKFSQLRL